MWARMHLQEKALTRTVYLRTLQVMLEAQCNDCQQSIMHYTTATDTIPTENPFPLEMEIYTSRSLSVARSSHVETTLWLRLQFWPALLSGLPSDFLSSGHLGLSHERSFRHWGRDATIKDGAINLSASFPILPAKPLHHHSDSLFDDVCFFIERTSTAGRVGYSRTISSSASAI